MKKKRRDILKQSIKKKSFGPTLRRLRKESGLTLTRVAEEVECSLGYLSDIERGRRDPIDSARLKDIAELLASQYIQSKTADELTLVLDMAAIFTTRKCVVPMGSHSDNKRELMAILSRRIAHMGRLEVDTLLTKLSF